MALGAGGLGRLRRLVVHGVVVGGVSAAVTLAFIYGLRGLVAAYSLILGVDPSASGIDYSIAAVHTANRLAAAAIASASVVAGFLIAEALRAREAMGAGIESLLYSYHFRAGVVRARVVVAKIISTIATIGGGGSGGLQGPGSLIGGGIGSSIARVLGVSGVERKTLVLAGVAGSLAAIFQAPIGAAVFALEIPYKRDIEARAIVPVLFASITGFLISYGLLGDSSPFPRAPIDAGSILSLQSMLSYIVFGFFSSAIALAYVAAIKGVRRLRRSLSRRAPDIAVTVAYAIALGVVGFLAPGALGLGSSYLSSIIESLSAQQPAWEIVPIALGLLAAKSIATALTVNAGASAGLFGPGLFAGALAGILYYHTIGHYISPLPPAVYAYIGMAAVYGAASTAPFGTSILISEITRNYTLLLPCLTASIISREVIGRYTLYERQRNTRMARDLEDLLLLIEALGARDLLSKPVSFFARDAPVAKPGDNTRYLIDLYLDTHLRYIPVVDSENRVIGLVDVESIPHTRGCVEGVCRVEELRVIRAPCVPSSASLGETLDLMTRYNIPVAVVVDHSGSYAGVVSAPDMHKHIIRTRLRSRV